MKLPALDATWLLQRFGVHEAIVGDLIEQRHHGRPSLWYWRQIFLAILARTISDARRHKLLTFRAVAVGFVTLWLCNSALEPLLMWINLNILNGLRICP